MMTKTPHKPTSGLLVRFVEEIEYKGTVTEMPRGQSVFPIHPYFTNNPAFLLVGVFAALLPSYGIQWAVVGA